MSNTILGYAFPQFHFPFVNPVVIFTLVLFIILLAPILMAKIRVPYIVGFIIADVASKKLAASKQPKIVK